LWKGGEIEGEDFTNILITPLNLTCDNFIFIEGLFVVLQHIWVLSIVSYVILQCPPAASISLPTPLNHLQNEQFSYLMKRDSSDNGDDPDGMSGQLVGSLGFAMYFALSLLVL